MLGRTIALSMSTDGKSELPVNTLKVPVASSCCLSLALCVCVRGGGGVVFERDLVLLLSK